MIKASYYFGKFIDALRDIDPDTAQRLAGEKYDSDSLFINQRAYIYNTFRKIPKLDDRNAEYLRNKVLDIEDTIWLIIISPAFLMLILLVGWFLWKM